MLIAERRVLLFDGTQITALHWKSGVVKDEGNFSADTLGLEAFEAYLLKNHKSLFYLLADVSEEGFQLENIPYVQGSDRAALLKRRLGQYFYGTPLSVGISLGRTDANTTKASIEGQETKRRDEQVLFAALTRPEAFEPWLNILASASVPLAGLYSVPLVFANNVSSFIDKRDTCLLISISAGGLRQTYFEHGKMHFSRLTPLTSLVPDEVAASCLMEATKTYQYLVGQRQIKRGTTLTTVITAGDDLAAPLQAACRSNGEIDFEVTALSALAKNAGVKTPPAGSSIDYVLVHRLLTRLPKYQFAPREHRRLFNLWQLRAGIQGTAFALLFAALLLGGRFTLQWFDLSQRNQQLQRQVSEDTQRYQSLLTSLPKIALGPDELRSAITGFEHLQKRSDGFTPLLAHLGKTLSEMPSIELLKLDWTLTQHFAGKPAAAGAANPAMGLVSAAGASTVKPVAWHTLDIEGRLPAAMASDQRAMIELIDRFAARLQRDGVEVLLTKRPVDVESAKSFKSGGPQTTDPDAATPHFSLRIGKGIAP